MLVTFRHMTAAGFVCAVLAAAGMSAGPVQAAETGPAIGSAKYVKKWAREQIPDVERDPLYARDDIFRDQRVWTVRDAATQLIIDDGTDIRLGERANRP